MSPRDIGDIINMATKEKERLENKSLSVLDLKIPLADPMECIAKVANNAN
jgi:hypothetical protein